MKRKILPIALSLALCFGASMTAFAADIDTTANTGTEAASAVHSYEAYQIFTGTYEAADKSLSNVEFGSAVTDAMKSALIAEINTKITDDTKKLAADAKAGDIAAAIGTYYDSSSAEAIAKIVKDNLGDAKFTVSNGKVDGGVAGYYLIVDVTDFTGDEEVYLDRAQLQIVDNELNVKINEKRDSITTYKKVKDINDSVEVNYSEWQDSADYDIGDSIPFMLYATVPSNYDSYSSYEYIFHDVQSAGLTFKADTVKVYVDDAQITDGYVVNENVDGDTFQVVFADLKKIAAVKADSVITVEYESVLNGQALIGAEGNPNKMRVEFENDNGGKGKTPWDTVIVFTFKTEINKVDQDELPLAGAQFKIEKLSASVEDGKYVVAKDENGEDVVIKTLEVVINDEGTQFSSEGLDDGVYKITETVTPAGFNSIDPIYFAVEAEHDEDAAEPKLVKIDVTDLEGNSIVSDGNNLGEFTIEKDNEDAIDTTIINQHGAVLPSTGGIGTTIFYIIGGVLVVGAVVLLIVRRRMKTEEE